jgi:serine/threonine protein kinase
MTYSRNTRDENPTVELQAAAGERAPVSVVEKTLSSPIELGRVLRDRYVLIHRLGSGGKGEVFKALDLYRANLPEAQQYVAIKILHETAVDREEQLANLRREFYCTQMLSHRNIINVFELDRDGELDFFTMEYLEGERLSRVMTRLQPSPISRPQAWAIIREIGAAVECAHAHNVAHADLKPHNIMITDSGEVRVLDFGSARISQQQSPAGQPLPKDVFASVTPAYACCELLEGRVPDLRDDIYALACLSYELLAGTHPFQRRRATEARDFAIVPKRPPALSGRQWRALTMGLSWHRGGRSIAVSAWLKKLNPGRGAGTVPRARDIASAPLKPEPRRFGAAALCAVLVVAVGVWAAVAHRPGVKGAMNGGVSSVAASAPLNTVSAPSRTLAGPQPASPTVPAVPATGASGVNDMSHEVGRPKIPAAPKLPMVSVNNYTVRSGDHFAEIRVHRSTRLGSTAPFIWWTEAASAKPGVDYLPQGKAVQVFPKGKSSTSFFVKLVPSAYRTQPEMFYIAIAAPGRGPAPGPVERAAVWLPTNNDQS